MKWLKYVEGKSLSLKCFGPLVLYRLIPLPLFGLLGKKGMKSIFFFWLLVTSSEDISCDFENWKMACNSEGIGSYVFGQFLYIWEMCMVSGDLKVSRVE